MSSRFDVLVIEDEKIVVDSIKKILVPEGFTVDETNNVEIALQNLEKNIYKLIITDLMLPKISGLKLIEVANMKYPDIPIIMITGYATLENALLSLKSGAFDFIPKPFSFAECLGVVHRALNFTKIGRTKIEQKKSSRILNKQTRKDYSEKYYLLGKFIWVKLDRNGSAEVGVDHIFPTIIGDIKHITLPLANEQIVQGAVLAQIYTEDHYIHTIWAPLSGRVIDTRQEIKSSRNLINKDLFSQDWLISMIPTNLEEEIPNLKFLD